MLLYMGSVLLIILISYGNIRVPNSLNLTQRMKCLLSLREFDAQNVHFACVNLKQMMIPDGESQLWI